MSEMIVKTNSDRIKVKGGEYVQDLVRCDDCYWGKNRCVIHKIYKLEWCSAGVKEYEGGSTESI